MKLNADTGHRGLGQNPRVGRAIRFLNAGLVALFTLGQAQASMSMPGMQTSMVTQLRGLKGQGFDVAWSKAMLDHHAAAVAMARLEVQKGQVGKIKKAAATVIADQTREIALMQGWLRQWNQPAYTLVVKLTAPAAGVGTDRWFLSEMIPHHQGPARAGAQPERRRQLPEPSDHRRSDRRNSAVPDLAEDHQVGSFPVHEAWRRPQPEPRGRDPADGSARLRILKTGLP